MGRRPPSPPARPPGLDRAIAVQSFHTDELMTRRGVVGTAVGYDADGAPIIKGITAVNATVDVDYESGVARFVEQMIIEPGGFSAPGDSGSLVVVDGKGSSRADDRKPVGLLFAGSTFITVANPIDPILERFGVDVDGK